MTRAVSINQQFRDWLKDPLFHDETSWPQPQWIVVLEAPPINTGKIKYPESSLLACLALRLVAEDAGVCIAPMISAQEHHYMCSGIRNDKTQSHKVLKEWAPDVITNFDLITNEALRDALCVGLAFLKRYQ